MTKVLFVIACVLSFASSASAADVSYVLQTPGVTWGGSSAKARAAVENVKAVQSVKTDMDSNTLTVEFDDAETSVDDIVTALAGAGYAVPSYKLVE